VDRQQEKSTLSIQCIQPGPAEAPSEGGSIASISLAARFAPASSLKFPITPMSPITPIPAIAFKPRSGFPVYSHRQPPLVLLFFGGPFGPLSPYSKISETLKDIGLGTCSVEFEDQDQANPQK
jgi:hypothetical protein